MLHASFGKHRSTTSSTQSAPSLPGVRSALRRIINDWWERLFTMVFGRVPLGEQAQLYSSHETTRDYVFNQNATTATEINTSSYAVIHQMPTALNRHADTDRYDALWTGARARQRLAAFRRTYDSRLYKQY